MQITQYSGLQILASSKVSKYITEIKLLRHHVFIWGGVGGFLGGASGKEPACQCRRHEMQVPSLGQEDPLEEGMATHSSILARRIPQTEEPGGLQSQRVRHN